MTLVDLQTDNTAQPLYPATGKLWMAQAHWQYSATSVAEGVLHNSSILLDESKSEINHMLVHNISNYAFPFVNIVEVRD